jgi:hypothetical protein
MLENEKSVLFHHHHHVEDKNFPKDQNTSTSCQNPSLITTRKEEALLFTVSSYAPFILCQHNLENLFFLSPSKC